MAMFFSSYTFESKLNTSVDGLLYFMNSFDFMDVPYLGSQKTIYDREYAFTGTNRINGFGDILALGYSGAIDLYILNENYSNNGFSTGIDLEGLNEQEGGIIHEDFLYGVYNDFKGGIQPHSQMLIQIDVMPMKFMSIFMKIVTQETNIFEYDNEKILAKLVSKILSKTKGETDYEGKIILKYKFENYRDSYASVYPLLVELQHNGHLDILGVDFIEGYLYFHIEQISDLDGIDSDEILQSIGTKKTIDLDFKFDGVNINTKYESMKLSHNSLKFCEYIYDNISESGKYDWDELGRYIYGNSYSGQGHDLSGLVTKFNNEVLKDIKSKIRFSRVKDSHIFIEK